SGPAWLFDIDSLTRTMNYHPVITEIQTNTHTDALVDGKEHDDDIQKSVSPDIHSSSSGAQTRKQGDKTENKDKDMPNLEDLTHSDDADDVGAEADINNLESIISVSPIPTTKIHKDHPTSQIIGDLSLTTQTRSRARAVRDQEEPKRVHQALKDPSWIEAMQEELLQFKMQKVWILVDLPYGKRAIGTKCIYRNKKDERGIVIRNKARLVAQGHTQEEGIDYEKCNKWMSKVHFSMALLKRKYTYVNHQGLWIVKILTKYTKRSRHFMEYIKLLELVKRIFKYLKGKPYLGLWYPKDSPFDLVAYSDSDYAGASLDQKSTTGGCQFLGCRLISWQCKKQTVVTTSLTEAEYVVAASGCA
nr:hypothetical protein [Tanacetum cinerariifolium]